MYIIKCCDKCSTPTVFEKERAFGVYFYPWTLCVDKYENHCFYRSNFSSDVRDSMCGQVSASGVCLLLEQTWLLSPRLWFLGFLDNGGKMRVLPLMLGQWFVVLTWRKFAGSMFTWKIPQKKRAGWISHSSVRTKLVIIRHLGPEEYKRLRHLNFVLSLDWLFTNMKKNDGMLLPVPGVFVLSHGVGCSEL